MPRAKKRSIAEARSDARKPAEIFTDYQESGSYLHDKLHSELEEFFREHESEESLFANYFQGPFLCLLKGAYASPFVKKTIALVVSFLEKRLEEEDANTDRDCTTPFLADFFAFMWKVQGLPDKNFRYNACKILAELMDAMAKKDISMDEDICDKISYVMISERIIDKVVDIRVLAASILQWLQDPTNPGCKAIKTLMYHLEKDPSVEVRKAIISVIRVTPVTLPAIYKRTRDVNEAVRALAFKLIADKRRMNALSYSMREKIIMSGLKDSSATVRTVAETYLLPKWLGQMQGNLVEFVKNLDVNFKPSVPRGALPFLMKDKSADELIAFMEIPEGEKYVPPDQLTPHLALYWSCLAKYFQEKEETEALEKILGSLSEYVHYINCFYKQEIPKDKDLVGNEQKEDKVIRISTLVFLFDLFSFYDMSDEVGRASMADIMLDILRSEDHQPDRRLLSKITSQLSVGIPDPYSRVDTVLSLLEDLYNPYLQPVVEVVKTMSDEERRTITVAIARLKMKSCTLHIAKEKAIDEEKFAEAQQIKTEIDAIKAQIKEKEEELNGPVVMDTQDQDAEREETKDPHVQYKCLVILCELLKNKEVFQMSLSFADIMERFVRKCIAIDQEHIMVNALEALGLYCMQSHSIAQKHLPMFYVLLINDIRPYESVRVKCLQCIVSLLVCHGREKLSITEEDWKVEETVSNIGGGSSQNQHGYLMSVISNMDNQNDQVKRQAVVGACQLLLAERVKSAQLLAKTILLWFLPATQSDGRLIKMMGQFFTLYAADKIDAPQLLAEALFIGLKEILTCSHSSELQELDPVKDIGFFILELTKKGTNKYSDENLHDKIAMRLLELLEFEDSEVSQGVYLRLLVNLAISYENNALRETLLETARRIKRNNLANSKNKDLLKFMLNLSGGNKDAKDSENISSTPMTAVERRTLIPDRENMITPIRSKDISDDEDSDNESISTPLLNRHLRI
ncbi:condensin complex subunit 3 [Cloeon dipterum]|uniref:condensin complex subunit 3 n=1 Tax=Cloeon dipterum TaxID=197152 RepID=UPI00321F701D